MKLKDILTEDTKWSVDYRPSAERYAFAMMDIARLGGGSLDHDWHIPLYRKAAAKIPNAWRPLVVREIVKLMAEDGSFSDEEQRDIVRIYSRKR